MSKRLKRQLISSLLLFLVALVGILGYQSNPENIDNSSSGIQTAGTFLVTSVVDGDTFKIKADTGTDTVRLIGVDTPETVKPRTEVECFGKEASDRLKQLIAGKEVFIQLDVTQGERDRFGRLLAYVWVNYADPTLSSQVFVNYELIAQGYAYEYTYNTPYKYQKQFKQAEETARQGRLGLWGECINKF